MASHGRAVEQVYEERRSVFKYALRGLMVERGIGVRELGRLIDPDDPARGKRNVNRYLSGDSFPNPTMQRQLEDVLGLRPGHIARMVGSKHEHGPDAGELLVALYDALGAVLQQGRGVSTGPLPGPSTAHTVASGVPSLLQHRAGRGSHV